MKSSQSNQLTSQVLGEASVNCMNVRANEQGHAADDDEVNRCPQCKKTFSTKQTLSIHMKTAKYCLEKKSQKVFECEYCGKRLSSKQMMLYHDDICSMKRQYLCDKRVEEIQALISNKYSIDLENIAPSKPSEEVVKKPLPKRTPMDSRSFCHMNVMVECQLLSNHSKSPTKKDSLVYQLYPCINRQVTVEPHSPMIVSTGLSLSIPQGWQAIVMNCDALHDEVLVVQDVFDSKSSKEVQVRIYNMMNRSITIEPDQPIAQLVFHKYADTFNVHMNCKSHHMLTT